MKKAISFVLALALFLSFLPMINNVKSNASGLTITLDPGHGNRDSGATGLLTASTGYEREMNLRIAFACKARLEQYGVTVYMTRTDNGDPNISAMSHADRVAVAKNTGSDAFISIHNNSADVSYARGCGVFIPNPYYPACNHNTNVYYDSKAAAGIVMNHLQNDVGIPKWVDPYDLNYDSDGGEALYYAADGSTTYSNNGRPCDYYGVLRNSKLQDIAVAMIIECCFVSNADDVNTFLKNDAKVTAMGVAIADALAEFYNLSTANYVNDFDKPEGGSSMAERSAVTYATTKRQNETFNISGWSVHTAGVSKYQAKIDNGNWSDITGSYRTDVAAATPTYTNCNALNAYSASYSLSSWNEGVHRIYVRGVTKSGDNYDIADLTLLIVPATDAVTLSVRDTVFNLNIGTEVTLKPSRSIAWIGLFGADEKPGDIYSYCYYDCNSTNTVTLDLLDDFTFNRTLVPGSYKLYYFIEQNTFYYDRAVNVTILDNGYTSLDFPTEDKTLAQGDNYFIQAWALSPDGIESFKYMLDTDDYSKGVALPLQLRNDVAAAFPNYASACAGGNSSQVNVSTADWTVGNHTVTIAAKSKQGAIIRLGTKNVTITEPQPSYVKGDLTETGECTTEDAVYLVRSIMAGESTYPLNQSADFDNNGTVNVDDAIYLLKHTLNSELYPL